MDPQHSSSPLTEIEMELGPLTPQRIARWQRIAQLMLRVKREELYRPAFTSFTAWVRTLAERFKIHESNFWRTLSAGEYYLAIRQTEDPEILKEAKAAPESLELVRKIARHAPEPVAEALVQKAVSEQLCRKDLRETWRQYRPTSPKAPRAQDKACEVPEEPAPASLDARGLAALVGAQPWDWHPRRWTGGKAFHEFPMRTGTTRHARRVDVLLALRSEDPQAPRPYLIGVEVKVSPSDLEADRKWSEYGPFVNELWVAVPQALATTAAGLLPDGSPTGIVCRSGENRLKVYREARPQESPLALRLTVLEDIIMRLCFNDLMASWNHDAMRSPSARPRA